MSLSSLLVFTSQVESVDMSDYIKGNSFEDVSKIVVNTAVENPSTPPIVG